MTDYEALQKIADIVMLKKTSDSARLAMIVGVLLATGDLKPRS